MAFGGAQLLQFAQLALLVIVSVVSLFASVVAALFRAVYRMARKIARGRCRCRRKANADSLDESFSMMVLEQTARRESLPYPLPPFYSDAQQVRAKFILVLDLDETLVHATLNPVEFDRQNAGGSETPRQALTHPSYRPSTASALSSPSPQPPRRHNGIVQVVGGAGPDDRNSVRSFTIVKRPYLDVFLQQVSQHFELCIFTASIRRYADPVLDLIDPQHRIQRRFFRDSCGRVSISSSSSSASSSKSTTPRPLLPPAPQLTTLPLFGQSWDVSTFFPSAQSSSVNPIIGMVQGGFTKDLSLVSSDLSRTILIDDSPTAGLLQPDNIIPITPWHDDPCDEALLDLLPFLMALRTVDDVRPLLALRREQHRSAPRAQPSTSGSTLSAPPTPRSDSEFNSGKQPLSMSVVPEETSSEASSKDSPASSSPTSSSRNSSNPGSNRSTPRYPSNLQPLQHSQHQPFLFQHHHHQSPPTPSIIQPVFVSSSAASSSNLHLNSVSFSSQNAISSFSSTSPQLLSPDSLPVVAADSFTSVGVRQPSSASASPSTSNRNSPRYSNLFSPASNSTAPMRSLLSGLKSSPRSNHLANFQPSSPPSPSALIHLNASAKSLEKPELLSSLSFGSPSLSPDTASILPLSASSPQPPSQALGLPPLAPSSSSSSHSSRLSRTSSISAMSIPLASPSTSGSAPSGVNASPTLSGLAGISPQPRRSSFAASLSARQKHHMSPSNQPGQSSPSFSATSTSGVSSPSSSPPFTALPSPFVVPPALSVGSQAHHQFGSISASSRMPSPTAISSSTASPPPLSGGNVSSNNNISGFNSSAITAALSSAAAALGLISSPVLSPITAPSSSSSSSFSTLSSGPNSPQISEPNLSSEFSSPRSPSLPPRPSSSTHTSPSQPLKQQHYQSQRQSWSSKPGKSHPQFVSPSDLPIVSPASISSSPPASSSSSKSTTADMSSLWTSASLPLTPPAFLPQSSFDRLSVSSGGSSQLPHNASPSHFPTAASLPASSSMSSTLIPNSPTALPLSTAASTSSISSTSPSSSSSQLSASSSQPSLLVAPQFAGYRSYRNASPRSSLTLSKSTPAPLQ